MWQYESPHWTSPALLDDGINKKSEYFNRAANRIKVEVHYEGGVRSVVWSHGLGKSLQQIFSSGEFMASEVPLEDWHGILGDGVAGRDRLCNVQGFNIHLGTKGYGLPAKNIAARFGLLMSQAENVCFDPHSMIGVGLHGLGPPPSPRVNLFPAAGAYTSTTRPLGSLYEGITDWNRAIPGGGGNRTMHTATKVVLYVDNGACTSYSIATTPSAHATIASSSPATVTGLQPMTAYSVSVHAINSAGTSPAVALVGAFRPCHCSCSLPNAPTITSIDSHQPGTLTVSFEAPADVPAGCVLNYTLRTSPDTAAVHATSSPATLTAVHPLTTSYTISIAAGNGLGLGPAASAQHTPAMVPKPDQGWDDLAMFALSAQPGSPAIFVLRPGVVNVSYWIRLAGDIDMTIRGAAEGGTVLDARKTTRFFVVGERATLRLHGPLTLKNGRAYDSHGGALLVYAGAKLFARDVVFTKNDCELSGTRGAYVLFGGAIFMWGERQTRLELNACNFTSNVLSEGGYKIAGAIWVSSGCSLYSCETAEPQVVITDSHFERNRSPTIFVRRCIAVCCITALYRHIAAHCQSLLTNPRGRFILVRLLEVYATKIIPISLSMHGARITFRCRPALSSEILQRHR
jgi:hypothetical protein